MTDADQLLKDLVARVAGARGAVLADSTGLLTASHLMPQEDAEQMAAIAAGMWSLGRRCGDRFDGGGVRQATIELEHIVLHLAGRGTARLLVLADAEGTDYGLLTYEAAVAVRRLTPPDNTSARPT